MTIKEYSEWISDIAKVEEKRDAYFEAKETYYNEAEDVSFEEHMAHFSAYDKAHRKLAKAVDNFNDKYNTPEYSTNEDGHTNLTYDVHYYDEARAPRIYEIIANTMLRLGRQITI